MTPTPRPAPAAEPAHNGPRSGSVKWFDTKKGYGFIVGPAGEDVFVHFSHILTDGFRTLKDGEPVEYDLLGGERGLNARNVRRVSRPDKALLGDDPTVGHARTAAENLAATLDPPVTPSMAPTVLPDRPHEPEDPAGA